MRHAFLASAAAAIDSRALCIRPDAIGSIIASLSLAASFDPDAGAQPSGLAGLVSTLAGGKARPAPRALSPHAMAASALGGPAGAGAIRTPYGCRADGVAVIRIEGCLWQEAWSMNWGGETFLLADGYDRIVEAVTQAVEDGGATSVLLDVRSPGGVVAGLFEAMDAIAALTQRAGGPKPIVAHINDQACSAAYGLVSQCDRIDAAESSLSGNIGAIRSHYSFAEMLAKAGIKPTLVKSHELKGGAHPDFDLDPGSQALMQQEIDYSSGLLVARVCAARGLTPDAVNALQAGWFIPPVSLGHGLIDGVGSFAATLTGLTSASSSPAAPAGPASEPETDMKRSIVMAALTAAGLTAAQISAVQAELPVDDEEAPAPEAAADAAAEPAPEDDAVDDPVVAETTEDPAPADAAAVVDPAVAQAVLDLPDAKGRETLAKKLAFQPGMTTALAQGLLAAAPRGQTLSGQMQGRDPHLTPAGGQVASTDYEAGQQIGAQFAALTGRARKAA